MSTTPFLIAGLATLVLTTLAATGGLCVKLLSPKAIGPRPNKKRHDGVRRPSGWGHTLSASDVGLR